MGDPGRITCQQKQELLAQINRVSKEKASLQKEELEATLSGQTATEIALRMDNAREMRKVLMERLKNHIAIHGC